MVSNGVLVLNRNWLAIHVCSVQRAMSLLVQGLAQVVTDDYQTLDFNSWREVSDALSAGECFMEGELRPEYLRTPNFKVRVPEVILLTSFHRVPPRAVKFNRRNIYLRDNFQCQYCGVKPVKEELTIDHINPRSRGGISEWENVVLACQRCNSKKGNQLLDLCGLKLLKPARKPHWLTIVRHSLGKHSRPTWHKFVDQAYWNVNLEE
jgi:5-methylcytosine-specific restriction endonuclease McrA